MRHVNLDREDPGIQDFVRSLLAQGETSVLELEGRPVARITPIPGAAFDADELKAALLRRRDESLRLNEDWLDADREVWDRSADSAE